MGANPSGYVPNSNEKGATRRAGWKERWMEPSVTFFVLTGFSSGWLSVSQSRVNSNFHSFSAKIGFSPPARAGLGQKNWHGHFD